MSNVIKVVSSRQKKDTQVKNIIAGVPAITNETIVNLGLDVMDDRITTLEEMTFQQGTAPTIEQGASEGDVWMDTSTDTLKVYREYPVGSGNYIWEILLYKNNDIVDGGTW